MKKIKKKLKINRNNIEKIMLINLKKRIKNGMKIIKKK